MTNTCNFRCLMCPTGTFSMKRPKGFMAEEVFYKILDEVAPRKTPLRFIRWGEPLMHPKLVEFVTAAHGRGVLTHINTNGSKLDRPYTEALIQAGLDSIKFSFQGVDRKSFGEMRNTDFFDGLIDTIRLFVDVRGERKLPYIHVSTTITYETKEQVIAFKALLSPLVDLVSVGRTVLEHVDLATVRLRADELEMLKSLKEQESVVRKHPECPEVFDKMSIDWDGTVTACCSDSDKLMPLGSVKDSSLEAIWNSDTLNHYRALLVAMRHDELPLCKTCYDYHGLQTPGLQDT
ncbi:radical SAM/SPASM domain-containing protein [Paramagnetospirillum marisnigri]|nr:radical SAM protein [Paramagnetospirillum marisnigri]